MSISPELMYAILAMDSYNRGYNPGIGGLSEDSQGNVKIGTATISYNLQDAQISEEAVAAGFYAVAYDWNGETVISYRGTDNLLLPEWVQDWYDDSNDGGSDLWNGYGTGVRDSSTEQAKLAAEFYQAVTGTENSDPLTGSATLTGHSLGGGLAGFIGALYHQDAVMFANMPFELAVDAFSDRVNGSDAVATNLQNDFYNGSSAPDDPLIGANLQTHAVTGELLEDTRSFQTTPETSYDSHSSTLNIYQDHWVKSSFIMLLCRLFFP